MCRFRFLLIVFVGTVTQTVSHADVYELRTYTTNEGKLDALHTRFRDHTLKLFEKHGIQNIAYWVPTDEATSNNTLVYVIKHKSREAAKESWQAFIADPDWKAAYQASVADGKLVSKVESVYMNATDYSPEIDLESSRDSNERLYELRVYTTHEGRLENLNARFRDHTMKLFEKHGIDNVAYWTPTDEPNSTNQLIYLISHQDADAAKASWRAFGSDPAWKKVAKESQVDGRIVIQGGVKRTYMSLTDYSPQP